MLTTKFSFGKNAFDIDRFNKVLWKSVFNIWFFWLRKLPFDEIVQDLGRSELFDKYRIFYGKESNLKSCIIFINERLRLGDSIIFIVTYQGRAVGFTQLYPKFSSVQMTKNWIINDLYVMEQFRSKGVGTMLLKKGFEIAKSKGSNMVYISTQKTNLTAQSLYQYLGFKNVENKNDFLDYNFDLSEY